MNREIIDFPLPMLRLTSVLWDIDWGSQSVGQDTGGGDQAVLNRFPRFKASLGLRFERDGIGYWRALRSQLRGKQNAFRIRMADPVTMDSVGAVIDGDWLAWKNGLYIEPRPTVRCVAAVLAGATTILVDETAALAPVQVGAHLSYADWPFLVEGRSGSGAAVTLQVALLRSAIPTNGAIDLIPRGLFLADDPMQGAPGYGRTLRSAPEMALTEWITR